MSLECSLWKKGFRAVAGLDEAGRGALFGPVVSAAVIFPPNIADISEDGWVAAVDDSKRLTPGRRTRLAESILCAASAVGIGFASPKEIDKQNVFWASMTAMKRALSELTISPDFLLVDGFPIRGIEYPQTGIPGGDARSTTIAAASILAKVFRDDFLLRVDSLFPGYGLGRHKGYATLSHYRALEDFGPTKLHRRSFRLVKNLEFEWPNG
ncbi:MAG: ribonuclease HII [Candidatus Aminicenantes bacterium]|nr:ribonuclease HII [Candidatus Aminicenantes bacterium]